MRVVVGVVVVEVIYMLESIRSPLFSALHLSNVQPRKRRGGKV
jgi:hypothetical protein